MYLIGPPHNIGPAAAQLTARAGSGGDVCNPSPPDRARAACEGDTSDAPTSARWPPPTSAPS
eukprot:1670568-Pyramimonas_sp.AAC.1